ncbi:MAG: TniQ family protein [Mycobacterium sp.]|nr:TniQ family protein [Mycobacterium sp.]
MRCARRRLPSRPAIHPDEALDGYLERLATANCLDPAQLLRTLSTPAGTPGSSMSFLMIKPTAETVTRLSHVSGLSERAVRAATLMRFDGDLPLRLEGFDARDRHSFRNVVNQGWFPQTGSQICTECLAEEGIWRLQWRLPIVVACLKHRTLLTASCGGCGLRFRLRRYSPLRPSADHACGNQLGLRHHCPHSILEGESQPAPEEVLSMQRSIDAALAGAPTELMGQMVAPQIYLAELRNTATLLLHLLTRPGGRTRVQWGSALHTEASARTTELRGPRWGVSPPTSSLIRAGALSEAWEIVTQSSLDGAAAKLSPWLDLIADIPNGPGAWLVNRTARTEAMERLIAAALLSRHDVARQVSRNRIELPVSAIPQLIDRETYRTVFAGMLGGYEHTGRLYVSLCLVRAATSARNWSQAAELLGLDPAVGPKTARAASARRSMEVLEFARQIRSALVGLPTDRSFRAREDRVRQLADTPDYWFEQWRCSIRPARNRRVLPYAINWMWCEVAQGFLSASPAWAAPPDARVKAAYRAFSAALPPNAAVALGALVLQ